MEPKFGGNLSAKRGRKTRMNWDKLMDRIEELLQKKNDVRATV